MAEHLDIVEHYIANQDGWLLHLKQTTSPEHMRAESRPLLIVPGYGMNTFIFGYHPRGTSLERELAEAGFEVWSVNLRHQGPSRPEGSSPPPPPSLRSYAEVDVAAAVDAVLERTRTRADRVDLLGASLGGSIAYAHLALSAGEKIGALVTLGSPLRWVKVHPVVRAVFGSPTLAGQLRFKGTQRFASLAFPLLVKIPDLLSIYMNARNVDLSDARTLTRTVEDPHPRVNKDIAHWIRSRDMVLRGVNVTQALRQVEHPLLVVLSNRDGIVPPSAALSVLDAWGGRNVEVLRVGDAQNWYAHADLFIGNEAPKRVFQPIAEWLHKQREWG